ncbi:hypothetical protein ACH4TP_33035 [Streptomyces sp. NPDC021012]|uniref:hypothetical protein n=1 Tax=Streptomyces sp. NPDC021012 TaxID=3365107 RepID=UPI00379DC984
MKLKFTTLVAASVIILSGCGGQPSGQRDFVDVGRVEGVWVTGAGARIEFLKDGEFHLSGMFREDIRPLGDGDVGGVSAASGTWVKLGPSVQLDIDPSKFFKYGQTVDLQSDVRDGESVLYFWIDGGVKEEDLFSRQQ